MAALPVSGTGKQACVRKTMTKQETKWKAAAATTAMEVGQDPSSSWDTHSKRAPGNGLSSKQPPPY